MGIHRYRGLPDEVCDALVSLYEQDKVHHDAISQVVGDQRKVFTQLQINYYHAKIVPTLTHYATEVINQYIKDVPTADYLPPIEKLEGFRVKKYVIKQDERFDLHVDASDSATATRCLAMLFYLNDIEEGGLTVFPFHDLEIKPKKGEVVVFPPTWEYPHLGQAPISNDKYIMSTYLHHG